MSDKKQKKSEKKQFYYDRHFGSLLGSIETDDDPLEKIMYYERYGQKDNKDDDTGSYMKLRFMRNEIKLEKQFIKKYRNEGIWVMGNIKKRFEKELSKAVNPESDRYHFDLNSYFENLADFVEQEFIDVPLICFNKPVGPLIEGYVVVSPFYHSKATSEIPENIWFKAEKFGDSCKCLKKRIDRRRAEYVIECTNIEPSSCLIFRVPDLVEEKFDLKRISYIKKMFPKGFEISKVSDKIYIHESYNR